ncbi:hypothetical protein B0H16DRAFT_1889538 [Mycena metata]|uniref:DUF6534 domain-containing protein n=1 Tax=Mycena metata TaxID=1033252 RepID=A0AAD7N3K3_9AGAR|nr:hypothetical protein B0H16DRAFT_1889538 [Mycena metata]
MLQLDLILGPYLLGILFNTFLYGLIMAQFLTYFNTKFNDPVWTKAVVWSLLFTDTIHSAVEIYAAWQAIVQDNGNLASLSAVTWISPFTVFATSAAACITQFFLAYRLFCLTRSKALLGIILVLSTIGLVTGCVTGIRTAIFKEHWFSSRANLRVTSIANEGPIVPFVVVWLTVQSFSDFLIAASLVIVLIRSRTGFRRTDAVINRLIQGAIETGTFASMFAFAALFSFVFFPETELTTFFGFPIGRIYTNTLLHSLNARANLSPMDSIIDLNCSSEDNTASIQLQGQSRIASSVKVDPVAVTRGRHSTAVSPHQERSQFQLGQAADQELNLNDEQKDGISISVQIGFLGEREG